MSRRVLVCGGRDYNDKEFVFFELDRVHESNPISVLIHGASRGADSLAAEWAKLRGVREERYLAQWHVHGKSAGPIRNAQMLRLSKPDVVIAFPGGRGTADMVKRAQLADVPVEIHL